MLYSAISCIFSLLLGVSAESPSPFQKYTISAPGINATFIPYGARITNLFVNDKNGHPQDVVVGYDDPTKYVNDRAYTGPVIGFDSLNKVKRRKPD